MPTLVALVLVVVTISLGNWQMRRADEKRALQAQHDAAERDEPVDLTAAGSNVDSLVGRRVRVRGRFVSEFDVYVDNRTHRGVAGFHVLTPLRIAGSESHLLILRGWIAGGFDRAEMIRATGESQMDYEAIRILGQRGERRHAQRGGVVEEDVEPAEVTRGVGEAAAMGGVAHVSGESDHRPAVTAQLPRRFRELCFPSGGDHETVILSKLDISQSDRLRIFLSVFFHRHELHEDPMIEE